jgi:hypothetical protein
MVSVKVECSKCVYLGKLCVAGQYYYCHTANKAVRTPYASHDCKAYRFVD